MKKTYVKPVINASMNGTLEGVYACYDYKTSSRKDNNCWQPSNPCTPQPGCGYEIAIWW